VGNFWYILTGLSCYRAKPPNFSGRIGGLHLYGRGLFLEHGNGTGQNFHPDEVVE
jgi:hypothetical protein